jgi:hypothetical protein
VERGQLTAPMDLSRFAGSRSAAPAGASSDSKALARPHARPFDMTGRSMKGRIRVGPDVLGGEPGLADWVSEGVASARPAAQEAVELLGMIEEQIRPFAPAVELVSTMTGFQRRGAERIRVPPTRGEQRRRAT